MLKIYHNLLYSGISNYFPFIIISILMNGYWLTCFKEGIIRKNRIAIIQKTIFRSEIQAIFYPSSPLRHYQCCIAVQSMYPLLQAGQFLNRYGVDPKRFFHRSPDDEKRLPVEQITKFLKYFRK